MYRILFILLVISSIYAYTGTTKAEAPDRTLNDYSVQELVRHFASKYHVSENQMLGTIKGESSLNAKAVGDHGCSIGLSQINLCAHTNITREQAENPIFSIEFMASEFAKGNQRIWTVWRNLYE